MAFPQTTVPIIIVGAGVFGSSTALELARKQPVRHVILVDPTEGANPQSASHDVSKIVRDDYVQPALIAMARKAMAKWRDDPLFTKHFHKIGMLRCQPDTFNEDSLAAYRDLGILTKSAWMTTADVRDKWPVLAQADFGGLDKVMYNPDYGFVEAAAALGDVRKEAVAKGVELVVGEVSRVAFDDAGDCTGVVFRDGRELRGTVLLCTGARTASLLVDSAPEREELHAGSRLMATGAVSFTVTLNDDERKRFEHVPVFKNRAPEVMGEGMSLFGNTLKFNCDMCFTRNGVHASTNKSMSFVPAAPNLTQWTDWNDKCIPEKLKKRAEKTLKGLHGKELEGKEIDQIRICWDAHTPNHDFIISPHPRCSNLYVATGGSFHGWKFFPVIGEYIAQMLDGTLDETYRALWAWDRGADGPRANTTYDLEGDLGEM
ncbi:L-pipecolate oxidase [Colletotrichum trifolii]|uniref:L-pipecolate oxidase n=1 Tax=Colletotrichum trifolii TaxID=5466 RepID=A0A4R8RHB4_COLTR|nr:L-pipecolate oxidase [Colletotrichum trifolii]